MKKRTKFGSTILELKDVIQKYGCGLGISPPYIVHGQYNSPTSGPVMGILAAASNQFHAYLIWREVMKNGRATVYRTEFHPNQNFSIETYKAKVRENMEAQRIQNEAQKRQDEAHKRQEQIRKDNSK